MRTWVATDACLNSASFVQTIIRQDNIDPVFTFMPADTIINCVGDTMPSNVGIAIATDECNNPPVLTYSDMVVAGPCANTDTILRTWVATDACVNSSSFVQTITVQDTTKPVFTFMPLDTIINCPGDTMPSNVGIALATDECNDPPVITYSDVVVAGPCANTDTILRTWVATDACLNSSSFVQTITVQDTTKPVFTFMPLDTIINCPGDTIPATVGIALATDECNDPPVITYSDVVVAGPCANTDTILRTWVATDACLNSSSFVQTITVQDTTKPVFTFMPLDTIINCPGDTMPATVGIALATDECNTIRQ